MIDDTEAAAPPCPPQGQLGLPAPAARLEARDVGAGPTWPEEQVQQLTHTLGRELATLLRHGTHRGRNVTLRSGSRGEVCLAELANVLHTPPSLLLAVAKKDYKRGVARFMLWEENQSTYVVHTWGGGRERRRR